MADIEVPQEDLPSTPDTGMEVPQSDLPDTSPKRSLSDSGINPSAPDAAQQASNQGIAIGSGDEVPSSDLPEIAQQPASGSTLDTLKASELGLERGLTSGLSDVYRTKVEPFFLPKSMQTSAQEINNLQEQHPIASGIGQGAGSVAQFAALNELLPGASSAGAKALKAFAIGAGTEGLDNAAQSMLGKGDPEEAVSGKLIHMVESGGLNALTDGIFNASSKGLSKLAEAKAGTWGANFLAGVGYAGDPSIQQVLGPNFEEGTKNLYANPMFKQFSSSVEGIPRNKAAFNAGQKFVANTIEKGADLATSGLLGTAAGHVGGPIAGFATYGAVHAALGPAIEKLASKTLTPVAKKLAVPAAIHALSTGDALNLFTALNHANEVGSGLQSINSAINSLFKPGTHEIFNEVISDKKRDQLKDWVKDGGLNKQIDNQIHNDQNGPTPLESFAEGGIVPANDIPKDPQVSNEPDRIATLYPEQNMMVSAAKGRIYNYLNGIRPQENNPKLPFDEDMKDPEQERAYNRAIDIAIKPLSVLGHIKSGTLTPEHVQHLNGMYPEVYNQLNKKITSKIMESQMKEEKPNYKTRQGLSMFMAAPLDSTFTPMAIQAAQGVFAQQNAQKQAQMTQQSKPKKNTSKLSKLADQYKTGDQAAASRQQNGS